MLPQLKVLMPLFGIFILIFLIIRHLLIPDSFGQDGYYRAASLNDNSHNKIVYAVKSQCIECHADIGEKLSSDVHSDLSCVTCHGPGLDHVNAPESVKIMKPGTRNDCSRCHALNPARQKSVINQIDPAKHHIEKNDCIECHNPHQVWEKLQ